MSGPQTPTPVRPQVAQDAKKNPLAYVIARWNDFSGKAKAGTLGADHAKSIRTILTQQPRAAILQGWITLKLNIFKDLYPLLDPRLEHGGPPALTLEQYNRENALALEDLRTLSLRGRLVANQSGSGSATGMSNSGSQQGSSPVGTPQPQPQPQLQAQPQSLNAGTSPAPILNPNPNPNPNLNLNPTTTGSPRPNLNANGTGNATALQSMGRPPIRPSPLPLPEGLMTLPDVRKLLAIRDVAQREAIFARTPGLKEKFVAAVSHYQNVQNQNRQNSSSNSNPPSRAGTPGPSASGNGNTNPRPPSALAAAPSSGPSTPSSSQNTGPSNSQPQPQSQPQTQTQTQTQAQAQNQSQSTQSNQVRPPAGSQSTPARPPAPQGQTQGQGQGQGGNPHGATPTPNPNPAAPGAIPNRPFNLNQPPQRQGPPAPPPVPIENEVSRRKRKFREYVKEEAPGLEVEIGVDQIVSDYLDAFIDEAARGAIRLAKHRKGNKVELKDMALFLDVTHDVRLPGFNVQLPQKQHTSGDNERKKGKAVAPRAARKGKDAE